MKKSAKVVFKDLKVNMIYGLCSIHIDESSNVINTDKFINPFNNNQEEYAAIKEHLSKSLDIVSNNMNSNKEYYDNLIDNSNFDNIIVIEYKDSDNISIGLRSLYSLPLFVREEVIQ